MARITLSSRVANYGENPRWARLGGRVLGSEVHLEAQLLQAPDQPALDALAVARVEVSGAQVLISGAPLEQVVHDAQDAVAHGDGGFLLAQARDQAMILRGQI